MQKPVCKYKHALTDFTVGARVAGRTATAAARAGAAVSADHVITADSA